ncbi:MAG: hypothetical protein GY701_00625 [Sulfitobacter sp.]|nr:hypothetical protein [Sulfitobacter sp.]
MRPLRVVLIVLTSVLFAVVPAIPTAAGNGPNDCVDDCGVGGGAGAGEGAVSSVAWETKPGGGATEPVARPPDWLAQCSWQLEPEGDLVPPELADVGVEGGALVWVSDTWLVRCPASSAIALAWPALAGQIVAVFADGDVPEFIADAVIRQAADQIPLVAFYPNSAPQGTVDVPLIARFPATLWVPERDWVPVSAVASIPPLSVTATATPVATEWSGANDPESIECDQGTPIRMDIDFWDNNLSCSMLFHHTNNVADNELRLVVRWEVTYVCSAVCGTGALTDQFTESVRPVRVAEMQALVTHFGYGND